MARGASGSDIHGVMSSVQGGGRDDLVLLRALRKSGDEVQLTQTVGRLAQADQDFARALLRALVRGAPAGDRVADRLTTDGPVECAIERRLYVGHESMGRIDLVLTHPGLELYVEVKLHSDYRPNQLRDYLQALDPGEGEFLISVTRNISRFREPAGSEPGWLGSVRWARLATVLRDLPTPGPVREQWNMLLNVLEEDGDLGSIGLTPELVTAYERSDEAYERLTDFLVQIGVGALQRLRAELNGGDASDRSTAVFASARRRANPSSERGRGDRDEDHPEVIGEDEGLYLAFKIPAPSGERLWIGFYVGDGTGWFYIAAGWSEENDPTPQWEANWRQASMALEAQLRGRRFFCNEGDDLYVQLDYALAEFANEQDVPTALAARIEEDLPLLVASGLFAADLAAAKPRHVS